MRGNSVKPIYQLKMRDAIIIIPNEYLKFMLSSLVFCNTLHSINWLPYSGQLRSNDLAVFRICVSEFSIALDYLRSLLSADEESRRNRYHFEHDKRRFVIARGILKILVGHHLNRKPSDVKFTMDMNRKPQLKDSIDLHYNVSHSGDWVLISIGNRVVGIDLEKIDYTFFFQDIVAHSFSQAEGDYLARNNNRPALFYQLWTRKEAIVKATGTGIGADFDQIPSLDGEHWLNTKQVYSDKNWIVSSFNIVEDYLASIAYPIEPTAADLNFYNVDQRLINYEFN